MDQQFPKRLVLRDLGVFLLRGLCVEMIPNAEAAEVRTPRSRSSSRIAGHIFGTNKTMKITNGESVILVLHTPREKLLGILDEINQSGVFVRAIDLEYFDDWCRSIVNDEPYLPMSDYFIPMWRLERMTRDEGSPSLTELFEQRTGRALGEF